LARGGNPSHARIVTIGSSGDTFPSIVTASSLFVTMQKDYLELCQTPGSTVFVLVDHQDPFVILFISAYTILEGDVTSNKTWLSLFPFLSIGTDISCNRLARDSHGHSQHETC
jgi:hypothetical protein